MPTGYTSAVANGEVTGLADFAWRCSRAMMALVTMRDDPANAPIPERLVPSDYHEKRVREARNWLEHTLTLTEDECARMAADAYVAKVSANAEYKADRQEIKRRYEAMLAKVLAWETKADGIKAFMTEQLMESIRFDCGSYTTDAPVKMTAEEWKADQIAQAKHDIEYHSKQQAEEDERTRLRNEWLGALRESLLEPA